MNRSRNILRVLLPVAILALGVLGAIALENSAEPPRGVRPEVPVPLVRTLVAETRPVQLAVTAHGVARPRTRTPLVAEVSARVIAVSDAFAEGELFATGDVLLELDPTDFDLALSQARARIAAAELTVAQEEADARIAREDWESQHPDRPADPLLLREPQLARARAELEAARAALAGAERDVERCTLRAPYDGRVAARSVDRGQYVTAGRELGVVYAVDWAEVRLPVADEDLARLDLGAGAPPRPADDLNGGAAGARGPAVELRTDFAGAERVWKGTIVRTEGEVDPESRMVVLVARVEDPYGAGRAEGGWPLLSGLFVEARIEGRNLDAAVVLPRAALRDGGRVFVLDADDRLEIRDVRLHQARRDEVVVASGVAAGERVVVSPIELPVEGMALRESEAGR